MVLIHAYRIVAASIDRVWDVISDIDRDPDFWRGTRHIKNISKTENTVEREVVIAFRNSVCQEIVTIDPKKVNQYRNNRRTNERQKNDCT